MKRIVAVVLALVLCAAPAWACGTAMSYSYAAPAAVYQQSFAPVLQQQVTYQPQVLQTVVQVPVLQTQVQYQSVLQQQVFSAPQITYTPAFGQSFSSYSMPAASFSLPAASFVPLR